MALYEPYAEEFTPLDSPFKESFVPRDVAHLHHITTPADSAIDNGADSDTSWDGPGWFNHEMTTQEQNQSSPLIPVTPSHPTTLRDTTGQASESLPFRRRSSFANPAAGIEDRVPRVCSCCHMRHHSSAEAAEPCLLKYVHRALSECFGDFGSDLSPPESASSTTRLPHIGHSRLCEQLRAPHSLATDQLAELQSSSILPNQSFVRQHFQNVPKTNPCMLESRIPCITEDDLRCWSPRDFD
jgi:hypothetical protein